MVVVASKTLLKFGNVKQVVGTDSARQFAYESDVLGDIPGQATEFGKFFNKSLHVFNAVQLLSLSLFRCELLDVVFRILTEVTKVEVHVLSEERILVLADHDVLYLLARIKSDGIQVPTLNSGLISGTSLKFTRPLLIPRSSWTMAW